MNKRWLSLLVMCLMLGLTVVPVHAQTAEQGMPVHFNGKVLSAQAFQQIDPERIAIMGIFGDQLYAFQTMDEFEAFLSQAKQRRERDVSVQVPHVGFWVHANYKGDSMGTIANDPDLRDTFGGKFHDSISSLKVDCGVSLRVYEHINYRGASLYFNSCSSNSNLAYVPKPGGGTWNDIISSYKVYR